MALTSQQAQDLLKSNPNAYLTKESLISLIAQLDISTTGKTTILYSGLDKINAKGLNDTLKTGANLSFIDNTQAADFLNSEIFLNKVAKVLDIPEKDLFTTQKSTDFLFGGLATPNSGAWATASKQFALNASGDVFTLTPNSDPKKVFGSTELPALLTNTKVTSINGMPRNGLLLLQQELIKKGETSASALSAIHDFLAESSRALLNKVDYSVDSAGITNWINTAQLTDNTLNAVPMPTGSVTKGVLGLMGAPPTQTGLERFPSINKIISIFNANPKILSTLNSEATLTSTGIRAVNGLLGGALNGLSAGNKTKLLDSIKTFGNKYGGYIGAALILYSASSVWSEAKAAYASGDVNSGNKIVGNFVVNTVVSLGLDNLTTLALTPILIAGATYAGLGALATSALLIAGTTVASVLTSIAFGDTIQDLSTTLTDKVISSLSNTNLHLNNSQLTLEQALTVKDLNSSINLLHNEFDRFINLQNGLKTSISDSTTINSADSRISYLQYAWIDDINKIDSQREFTDSYLNDRLNFANYLEKYNTTWWMRGTNTLQKAFGIPYLELRPDLEYIDLYNKKNLTVDYLDLGLRGDAQQIVFGELGNDVINTGNNADKIYAMDGDDIINSGNGLDWDYVEGGKGFDTYQINSNDRDVIYDFDGKGQILIQGSIFAPKSIKKITDNLFYDNSKYTYSLQNNKQDLLILNNELNINIRIKNFINGNLGINLPKSVEQVNIVSPTVSNFIYGDNSPNALFDTPNSDEIYGYNDNDRIYSKKGGADRIDGGSGDDVIYGGSGNDLLIGGNGSDVVTDCLGADHDEQGYYILNLVHNDNDILIGGSTVYTNISQAIKDLNTQSSENTRGDFLFSKNGNDIVIGGNAKDFIFMGAGNQQVVAGSGDDIIEGLNGHIESASDEWYVKILSPAQQKEEFGKILYNGDILNIRGISHYFNNPTHLSRGVIQQSSVNLGKDIIYAGKGNDRIRTYNTNDDTIFGEDGNDWILSDDGNDTIDGGSGDDTIYYGRGNNIIFGGIGNDSIDLGKDKLSKYSNQIFGDDGNDNIKGADGNDYLNGGSGDDIIFAKSGNDEVYAENGNDKINAEDGNDIVYADEGDDKIYGGNGDDKIYGGMGNDEIYGENDNDELVGNEGDDLIYGGSGDDIIISGSGDDNIYGDDGTDTLSGGLGKDTYFFNINNGNDTIQSLDNNLSDIINLQSISSSQAYFERSNNNLVIYYSQYDSITINDYFISNFIIPEIQFSDKTFLLEDVNDTLYQGSKRDENISGNDLNNIIYGNAGNDVLSGMSGSDIYVFNKGDGKDTIKNFDADLSIDKINFGEGIFANKLDFNKNNQNLVINIKDSDDSITVENYFMSKDYAIDILKLQDGTEIDKQYISEYLMKYKFLSDFPVQNKIVGLDTQQDYLVGTDLNDSINGSKGYDYLFGGNGSDVYIFSENDGIDYISNNHSNLTDKDAILFDETIKSQDIGFYRYGSGFSVQNDLVLFHKTNINQKITVLNYFADEKNSLKNIRFASDNTNWDINYINSNILNTVSTDTDNIINGYFGNDFIDAKDGNDRVNTFDGNDIIKGGKGNDYIDGGEGDDTYIYELGDGNDTINDSSINNNSKNKLFFEKINLSDVTICEYNGLNIHINSTGHTVNISNFFEKETYQIYFNNYLISKNNINYLLSKPNDYNQYLYGDNNNNTIYGYGGNDVINGNLGNDTLIGGNGDDRLYGGGNDDVLAGEKGNDLIYGGLGNDIYKFNIGDGIDEFLEDNNLYIAKDDLSRYGILSLDNYLNNIKSNLDELFTIKEINPETNQEETKLLEYTFDESLFTQRYYDYLSSIIKVKIIGSDSNGYNIEDKAKDTILLSNAIIQSDLIFNYIDENYFSIKIRGTQDKIYARNIENIVLEGSMVSISYNQIKVLGANGSEYDDEIKVQYGISNLIHGYQGNDRIFGDKGNDILNGDEGNDILYSELGDDTLIGGIGNDELHGERGNKTYIFNLGDGTDTIYGTDNYIYSSSLKFGQGININNISFNQLTNGELRINVNNNDKLIYKNFFYYDWTNINNKLLFADGSSYDLRNVISKISSSMYDDLLSIVDGIDTINGQAGNDIIYGSYKNDSLFGGIDNDYLVGYAGNDILDGGFGIDTMQGGLGNDKYYVDNIGDIIVENANEGTDIVTASINYTLGDNLENLSLSNTGALNLNATGNSKNNIIDGNSYTNIIDAGAGNDTVKAWSGNDTITGGLGNDTLLGGNGADTYKFARGDGQDTVNNYDTDALSINQDIIEFYQNISSNQLWFTKNGNNLDISIIGTTDKMSIKDWYTNASNQVDKFKSSDGKELINADVDKLVQAMAAFTPPSMGQTTLPTNYQSSLNTTIAANWH